MGQGHPTLTVPATHRSAQAGVAPATSSPWPASVSLQWQRWGLYVGHVLRMFWPEGSRPPPPPLGNSAVASGPLEGKEQGGGCGGLGGGPVVEMEVWDPL